MFFSKFFKKNKKIKLSKIKEKFQNYIDMHKGIEEAENFLNELCNKNKKSCQLYAKIFFNIFKDIDTKKSIEIMKPFIKEENDIAFLKVYINRLKRVGEFELANKLIFKTGENKITISKSEFDNILNNTSNYKKTIISLLNQLSEQNEQIYFYAFSILKDKDIPLAIEYGLLYLKNNPDDFKTFHILKKRITNNLRENLIEEYSKLNEKIKYFYRIKQILLNNHNNYKFKKDLEIGIKKLNNDKLIIKLINELLENLNDKEKHQIIFNNLKELNYKESALDIAKKYLAKYPFDKKFKRSVKKLQIEIDKDIQKEIDKKFESLLIEFNIEKKCKLKQIKFLINEIKDFDEPEFDYIIKKLIEKYREKKHEVYKMIFSELKDFNVSRAIRYGKKYLQKNIQDCKFLKVFFKRLERIKDYDTLYNYAQESIKVCKDEEFKFIVYKYELKDELNNLNNLNDEERKNYIKELEKKYENFRTYLYRELFNFYKKKDYNKAEKYAKQSLKLQYNEYMIKDLYDLYIYYGDLSKAKEILPKNPKLPTLEVKKKNIESLIYLYKNGFDLKINKLKSFTPNKNKILYMLHNRLPYNSGGYATRSHGLLTGVSEYGWNIQGVSRLGYPYDKIKNVIVNEIDKIDNIIYHVLLKDNIGLGDLPLKDYLENYAESLLEFAKKEKPFLIHAASNYMNGVVANYVAKNLGIKSIYEVRGLWELTRISRQPEWENTEYYNLMAKMEAEAAKGADIVFTLTNALKDEMIRRGVDADKIYILPNGVVTERFSPLEKNINLAKKLNIVNKTVIGFVGSFVQYEGLEYIVDAIEILVKKGKKDIIALMVGDGAVWQDIVDRVEKKGLQDYFIFTGRIPHEEVEEYYSLVDIAPLPRKGLPVCEMVSPLKPFEAMAMEKVVLSSNVAALAEIVQDGYNGMLFEKDNIQDLAYKIELLSNDLDLRKKLGKQARQWVLENRDWKHISSKLNNIYKQLLEKQ